MNVLSQAFLGTLVIELEVEFRLSYKPLQFYSSLLPITTFTTRYSPFSFKYISPHIFPPSHFPTPLENLTYNTYSTGAAAAIATARARAAAAAATATAVVAAAAAAAAATTAAAVAAEEEQQPT